MCGILELNKNNHGIHTFKYINIMTGELPMSKDLYSEGLECTCEETL
jgi:hypothetical protein